MSFEIQPEHRYIGMWHYKIPPELSKFGKGGNFCAMLWRAPGAPENEWVFQFRFRYYRDERVFEHDDEMSWYSAIARGTEAEVEARTHDVCKIQATAAGSESDFYALHCDGKETLTKFEQAPPYWLHLQSSHAE